MGRFSPLGRLRKELQKIDGGVPLRIIGDFKEFGLMLGDLTASMDDGLEENSELRDIELDDNFAGSDNFPSGKSVSKGGKPCGPKGFECDDKL